MAGSRITLAVSSHRVANIWALLSTSIILVSSPSGVSCQSVTITSSISKGEIVCPGQIVTFECVTNGSTLIRWTSNEYIGGRLGFNVFDHLNSMLTGSTDPNTIATLVNNTFEDGTEVLVSELRIIVSSVSVTPSVTCAHGFGITDSFPFRVPDGPSMPQVTTADYVMGTCELNISLNTPDSFTTGDTIQVTIDRLNFHNATYSDNVTSITVPSCDFYNVSARIIDRCGREGEFSSGVTVSPGQLCEPSACTNDDSPPPSNSVLAAGVVVAIVVPIAVVVIAALVFLGVMIALCYYLNSKKNTPKRVSDIHLESKNGEEDAKLKES